MPIDRRHLCNYCFGYMKTAILILSVVAAAASGHADPPKNFGSYDVIRTVPLPPLRTNQTLASLPGHYTAPLSGQVATTALPGQVVKALPGQLVKPLPGQMVQPLPGQVVKSLPGQMVGSLSGEVVAEP
jgi:hypothetical protein